MGFTPEAIFHRAACVGKMTNCVWSPRMKANIGYALIAATIAPGEVVVVQRASGPVTARLVDLPFL